MYKYCTRKFTRQVWVVRAVEGVRPASPARAGARPPAAACCWAEAAAERKMEVVHYQPGEKPQAAGQRSYRRPGKAAQAVGEGAWRDSLAPAGLETESAASVRALAAC